MRQTESRVRLLEASASREEEARKAWADERRAWGDKCAPRCCPRHRHGRRPLSSTPRVPTPSRVLSLPAGSFPSLHPSPRSPAAPCRPTNQPRARVRAACVAQCGGRGGSGGGARGGATRRTEQFAPTDGAGAARVGTGGRACVGRRGPCRRGRERTRDVGQRVAWQAERGTGGAAWLAGGEQSTRGVAPRVGERAARAERAAG